MRDYGMSLETIERIYGSVAEYNRCKDEEQNFEPDYDDGMEIPYEEDEPYEPYEFEVGETYGVEDLYGGTTYYRCTKRTKNRIWFRDTDWRAWADGIEERDERKYTIIRNQNGDEEVLLYHSDAYDYDCKLCSYMPDGYNDLRHTY